MNQLKAAVVGAGFIGPVHVEALRRLGITVTGILGCDDAESGARCLRWGEGLCEPRWCWPTRPSTPCTCGPQCPALRVCQKGVVASKHVMCEKPLAMNANESAELVERQIERQGGRCATSAIIAQPPRAMARQATGEIFAVNSSYVQDWLLYDTDYNWRPGRPGRHSRGLDIGTHWMDGPVDHRPGGRFRDADLNTVHKIRRRPWASRDLHGQGGQGRHQPIEITTDDWPILFRFQTAARQPARSQVTAGRLPPLRNLGAKCAGLRQRSPNQLWIGHRGEPEAMITTRPSRRCRDASYRRAQGLPDAFKQCFRSFYQSSPPAISRRAVRPPSPRDTARCALRSHPGEPPPGEVGQAVAAAGVAPQRNLKTRASVSEDAAGIHPTGLRRLREKSPAALADRSGSAGWPRLAVFGGIPVLPPKAAGQVARRGN